jgi:hypothetical protein
MKDKTHYVDNKKLLEAMVEYKAKVDEAKANNVLKPQIPTYIGHCMLMIARRLSHKPNFINYPYREEMISDGVENCVSYIDNFDPNKSNNPFSYFTQIIYFAFLRRILKEKKQLYIKHKSLENSIVFNMAVDQNDFDDNDYTSSAVSDLENENMNDFIKNFELNLSKKKIKRKKGVEVFIEDEAPIENSDSN